MSGDKTSRVFAGLVLFAFLILSPAHATTQPEISVSDSWTYTGSVYYANRVMNYTETRTVTRVDKVGSFDALVYEVNSTENPGSLISFWYTRDLALLKKEFKNPDGSVSQWTYTQSLKLYDFPLFVGQSWLTSSDIQMSRTDPRDPSKTRTGQDHVTFRIKVAGEEELTAAGRDFTAYIVEYYYVVEEVNQLWYRYWFSESARANIKEITYTPSGGIFRIVELTSLSIAEPREPSAPADLALPLAIVVVVAVASAVFLRSSWKKVRRVGRADQDAGVGDLLMNLQPTRKMV